MPSLTRPESSRSLRPASISQPNVPASLDLNNVPSELQLVLGLLSLQAQRPYCDGYVLRKHVNLPDGKPAPDQEWSEFFAQLNGTILSLWDASAVDEAAYQGGQSVMPQFINVTDAIITSTNQHEHPDHANVLSISTAGSNRYLFEFQNSNVLRRWSAAFRISMYERAALQECYTAALIARSRTATNVRRLFSAYHGALGSKGKYSGWVRVRFSWSIKWQKCWAVVSDTPSSWFAGTGHGIHERLFYKFSSKQSLRGEVRFYESRRDAKNKPIAILGNVFAAYAVYPEKPFLVDSSTMIKVEGSLQTGRGTLSREGQQYKDAFVLLMPDDLPTTSGSNQSSPVSSPIIGSTRSVSPLPGSRSRFASSPSTFFSSFSGSSNKGLSTAAFESMLTWLVAFYDAFNLYGRPTKLITDASSLDSMIFAMPSSLEDSYLDVEEVFMTLAGSGQLENNAYSTRDWRYKMKELTLAQVKDGKKVFNPAILLKNTVTEIPVIRAPIPPPYRSNGPTSGAPVRTESAPAVQFPEMADDAEHAYPSTGPRQQNRLGFLRRNPSKPEDRHSRSLSDNDVENTRAAMNRFSLNEDSEEEPEFPVSRGTYQSSPLRNTEMRPSTADSAESDAEAINMQARMDRPTLLKRASSHRRGHSETRMGELYREAEERRGYSDEESERLPIPRRVSSDDMLKVQSGASLGLSSTGGRVSRESLETGTQFNRTFDETSQSEVSRVRLSESSSDRSDTPADPLRDTPQMSAVNMQSSPASSMESLPPSKLQNSPRRDRRSFDERLFNAPAVTPAEPSYHTPAYRDPSLPSVLMPVNGQPIPVRRDAANIPPQHASGPRSAPWSAVPLGPAARVDDVIQYNQDLLRPREHRPAPSPNTAKFPPAVGYPVQPTAPRPQQFPGVDNRVPYQESVQDHQMRARGPIYPPHQNPQRDPRSQQFAYPDDPRGYDQGGQNHRVPRRMLPIPFSESNRKPAPQQPLASAAARSAYLPRPSSPPNSRSASPHKRGGYPQGPRQLASQT